MTAPAVRDDRIEKPEPGRFILACAQCKQLRDLADLEWRRDVAVNVVAAVICWRCAA